MKMKKQHYKFSFDINWVPFWKDIKKYTFHKAKKDLFAAISLALLAIPQSIAYSILAGLPISAGLMAAIFGILIASFFGSSRYLISGPTTGVAILIQATVANTLMSHFSHLPPEEMSLMAMRILSQMLLIMGVIQIGSGVFKLGKLLQFVSRSVILGYFAGVAFAIIINQLFFLFDVPLLDPDSSGFGRLFQFFGSISQTNILNVLLGVLGIAILGGMKKYLPRFPSANIMLLVVGGLAFLFNRTIVADDGPFRALTNVKDLGLFTSPKVWLHLPVFDLSIINKIFPAAIAISSLSILEVFSVSRNIATVSGKNSNANQEVYSVGLANFFLSFLSMSMPVSGSASRTMVNFIHKAKTRFAGVLCSIIIALLVFFGGEVVKYIPLAGLSAILLFVAPSLIYKKEVKLCFKITKEDGIVFGLTFISCLIFSLDIAFYIGIIISIVSYLRKAAEPFIMEYAFNASGRLCAVSPKEKAKKRIRIIGIGGHLFFGVVDLLQTTVQKIAEDPCSKVIVLRLHNIQYIDASMCFAIMKLYDYLKASNRILLICGISDEVWRTLSRGELLEEFGRDNLFLTDTTKPQLSTWRACLRARELVS